MVASGGAANQNVHGLCLANSNSGSQSHSNGYLANVFLTECTALPKQQQDTGWVFVNGSLRADGGA